MDNDMTAYRKLSLLMLAVFLLVYTVGGVFYTLQARGDIERELGSVMELAASLPAPTQLAPELVPEMRHLRPVSVGEAVSGTTREMPGEDLWETKPDTCSYHHEPAPPS